MGAEANVVQAVFRRANEDLFTFAADVLGGESELLAPFLCECADRGCTRVVRLRPAEWKEVSSRPDHFVLLPGHEGRRGGEDVVERRSRFSIVRTAPAPTCA